MSALLKRLDETSYDGDINKLEELLQEEPLLLDMVLTEVRNNPLHIAALKNHVNFTRKVLMLKPELARQLNREGRSPLHLAAARGHLQVAQILVDKVGSDTCLIPESNYGYLPVHIAMVNGHHHVVTMLVDKCKETLGKTTSRHETLLHLAVMVNCFDCVGYLIDQGVNLNEEDENGNTCLHLAVGKRHRDVVTHLLGREGLKINLKNKRGLTALDVLLVSSLYSAVDISLICAMQRAGGKEAAEMQDHESDMTVGVGAPPPSNQRLLRGNNINMTSDKQLSGDAQTLLIVATLVATITFQAITNPPGGFIQPPIEKDDTDLSSGTFNRTWIDKWERGNVYPAGQPVLLWELSEFFVLDSLALFSSVSVILWLLFAEPKTKIVMKILVAIVWFAAFCTALAFNSAFFAIYNPDDYEWVNHWPFAFFSFYILAGLWATVRVICFLWQKAEFKIPVPNWIAEVLRWLRDETLFKRVIAITNSQLLKKIIYGLLIVCAVGAFVFATGLVYYLINYATYYWHG